VRGTQNSTPLRPLFSFIPILACCCHPKSKNEQHKKKHWMGAEKTNKQTINCVSTEQREIVSDLIIHVNVQVLFDRGWTYYWWESFFFLVPPFLPFLET
jgi:hypothetical protein